MQFRLEAIGVFEADIDFPAVEPKCPKLRFATPQNAALDFENVLADPAPFDGVNGAADRKALSKDAVQTDWPSKPLGRLIGFHRVGGDFPAWICVGEIERKRLHIQRIVR